MGVSFPKARLAWKHLLLWRASGLNPLPLWALKNLTGFRGKGLQG